MLSDNPAAAVLHKIVGSGAGSGMAVMFLCTGILGSLFSCLGYKNKNVQSLKEQINNI